MRLIFKSEDRVKLITRCEWVGLVQSVEGLRLGKSKPSLQPLGRGASVQIDSRSNCTAVFAGPSLPASPRANPINWNSTLLCYRLLQSSPTELWGCNLYPFTRLTACFLVPGVCWSDSISNHLFSSPLAVPVLPCFRLDSVMLSGLFHFISKSFYQFSSVLISKPF